MCHIMHRMAVQDVNQIVCLLPLRTQSFRTKIGKFTHIEGQLWGQDIQKKSHFIFRTLRNRSLPSYDSARNNLALYGRASIHHDLLDTWWRKCPIMIIGIDICSLNYYSNVDTFNLESNVIKYSICICLAPSKASEVSFRRRPRIGTTLIYLTIFLDFSLDFEGFYIRRRRHQHCHATNR